MKQIFKPYINSMIHETGKGPRFKVELWRGDEMWPKSLHIKYKFAGRYFWLCFFYGLFRYDLNQQRQNDRAKLSQTRLFDTCGKHETG